ncbi:hypothetical protein SYJ56_04710 [Algoriphagus sp. D3-2-R+10]|uniref:hypothetical protein n=1 Tax=Algoriphagus aurantiacus TaxID=3103948 RepID=UPI002B3F5A2B|nr:hypothetical protein [Algoriphagus sp. D3-2-R+10]MEB2774594.1 hypothetical protein [Algoriphagus sp. D3-2-R+10]
MKNSQSTTPQLPSAMNISSFLFNSNFQFLILFFVCFLTSATSYAEVEISSGTELISMKSLDDPIQVTFLDITQPDATEERISKEKMIQYLKKQGIITDPMNYKVQLTNEFISVNGHKQAKKIHEYIMKNFVKRPAEHLQFTMSITTD